MTRKPTAVAAVPRLALTYEEAAACIGIGRTSFYDHVLPELRVVYVGTKPLIPVADLDRYIERQARPASIDELALLRRRGGRAS